MEFTFSWHNWQDNMNLDMRSFLWINLCCRFFFVRAGMMGWLLINLSVLARSYLDDKLGQSMIFYQIFCTVIGFNCLFGITYSMNINWFHIIFGSYISWITLFMKSIWLPRMCTTFILYNAELWQWCLYIERRYYKIGHFFFSLLKYFPPPNRIC